MPPRLPLLALNERFDTPLLAANVRSLYESAFCLDAGRAPVSF
jgi:hypothetical protein